MCPCRSLQSADSVSPVPTTSFAASTDVLVTSMLAGLQYELRNNLVNTQVGRAVFCPEHMFSIQVGRAVVCPEHMFSIQAK